MVYLDNAATSWPKPPAVIRAMAGTLQKLGGNPGRSGHKLSLCGGRIIQRCREVLGEAFGAPAPENVIFTANCTEAINLAISYAQTNRRVLIVDCDLRRPKLARLLQIKNSVGLSNVLMEPELLDEAILSTGLPNLDVILSGDIPPNPSELLGNPRMAQLIKDVEDRYDYILMDTPPVDIVSDSCIVANILEGVLFLVRQNRTEKDAVARGIKQLELSGAKLMGFVLNGIEPDGGNGRYSRKKYKYGYRYKYYYESSSRAKKQS